MNEEVKKLFIVIIFSIASIVGGYLAYQFISKPIEEKAKASKEWSLTHGKVVVSKIQSEISGGKSMYFADIHYDYTVDGKDYRNSGVSVASEGTSTSSKRSVTRTIRKYPEDSEVKVYYNPKNPQESVLETGLDFTTMLLCKLPWLFVGIGILMIFLTIKQRLKK